MLNCSQSMFAIMVPFLFHTVNEKLPVAISDDSSVENVGSKNLGAECLAEREDE